MRPSSGLALSLYVLLGLSTAVHAEGSAEFDAGDTGINFRHDQALTEDTVLRVDILNNGDEKVCWNGNGSLRLYEPDETTLVGTIADDSCVGAVAGVTGAYVIDMLSNQLVGSSKTSTTTFREWDIRVCAKSVSNGDCLNAAMSGHEQLGRLWSYLWNFQQNTDFDEDYSNNGSVFAIVPGGGAGRDAVIEMQMRGVSGARYTLAANSVGPEEDTTPFTRVGRSTTVSGHRVTSAFPLYLNLPAVAKHNWLAPQITDVVLDPSCGTGVVQDGSPGSIEFNSNVTGQYVVVCDVNQDAVYDFASQTDFSSFGTAVAGVNMIDWDGRNNAGMNATPGDYNCRVRLNVGEFHYDAEDIETSYPGIRMFRIESDKLTRTGISMFWDDSSLAADAENMDDVSGQLSPSAPPAAGLDPGDYADAASAFYFTGVTPNGNARAWGNFDSDGKGNNNFLDQWAAADTAESNPFVVRVFAAGTDSDSDGLTNARECMLGANPNDEDSDGDGVLDGDEATSSTAPNTDNDGPVDILDPDSDNDGVTDGDDEARFDPNACRDQDGDACDDCVLTGSDQSGGATNGDGTDTDGDGQCNTSDSDDDGDGVADAMDGAPLDPQVCRDTDNDGCDDCAITGANGSGGDAADDGMDSDQDGVCNGGTSGGTGDDADGDGLSDEEDLDRDNDGIPNADEGDSDDDEDGVPNALDLDSDGDGLLDIAEAGGSALDGDGDGRIDALEDANRDGLHDPLQAADGALPLPDTDGDGSPDFLDADDDDDGILSKNELNDDGSFRDTDEDGRPNHLDADDDGDGVSTRDERTRRGRDRDTDGDGEPDHLDVDDDGDGVRTARERGDADRNGTPDRLERPRKGTLAGGALCSIRDPGSRSSDSGAGLWFVLAAMLVAAARGKRRRRLRRSGRTILTIALATAAALSGSERASAQVAVDQFRLAPLSTDGFGVSRPTILPHASVGALVALEYSNDPLVYERTPRDSDSEEHVISDDLVLHAVLAVGLWDRVTLYAGIPVHLIMDGDDRLSIPAELSDGAGLGDVSLGGRVLIAGDDASVAALAGEFTARVPTADWADKDQNYRGDAIGSYEPALVFEVRAGAFDVRARGAARLRKGVAVSNLDLGQELSYGIGARLRLAKPVWLHAEVYGSTYLDRPFAREYSPAEALLGAKVDAEGWMFGAAAGPGLLRGYGSPDYRVIGVLGYAEPRVSAPPRADTDRDGLFDDVDACPRAPEDRDGFEDADGCPDPDNDGDGVLDVSDRCRNKPEDADQFEDADGCPDPDNDHDGLLDADDRCPMQPEDLDQFEDTDGCPDPDNDTDGLTDVSDGCPLEPEDFDGWEDNDGCPEAASGLVNLTCEKIEIKDSVYFESGSDRIQERSFTLLNQVSGVLQAATRIKRLRVDGHTDDRGKDAYNLELSQRRAAAVKRYLIERGVADTRLTSEGYGETRPIADNKTAAGRSQNRRVEFVVVESEGCP